MSVAHPLGDQTLVLCPIGLGNFLMATPALKALSRGVGPDRLTLLALKPSIADMANASRLFGRVLAWDPDQEGLGRGLALLRTLRSQGFAHSLAFFPSSHWKFTAFHFGIGARRRLGFSYPQQRFPAWAQRVSLPLENVHDTFQNLRLVEKFLDRKIEDPGEPFFPLTSGLPPGGIPPEPYFACHPGSSAERGMVEKRLPPEAFARIILRLHRETRIRCVLVGGPEETLLRKSVAEKCREAVLDVRPRSLIETAGLLQSARFFLGNDSGLMHLAAAVGTRCAAFFGPTDERRTGPFGYWERQKGLPRHLILRRGDLACAPCWTVRTVGKNPPCIYGDTRCLRDFDPDGIWERLREWVGHLGTPTATR